MIPGKDEKYIKMVSLWTGSSVNGQAWFVGFLEQDSRSVYFAVCLNDMQNVQQITAAKATEILEKFYGYFGILCP